MSLQLGANFPGRWLAAPQEIRQQFLRDLNKVCTLLDPKTDFNEWESEQTNASHQIMPSQMPATIKKEAEPQTTLPISALIALEQRLLKQADQVIERALDPLRAELKNWIQAQIRQEIKTL